MMQKRDYSMAYISFKLSCEILEIIIHGGRGDSRKAMDKDDDIAINKFILACRQFQKGLANFNILRKNFTNRELLDKDIDFKDDFETRMTTEA